MKRGKNLCKKEIIHFAFLWSIDIKIPKQMLISKGKKKSSRPDTIQNDKYKII